MRNKESMVVLCYACFRKSRTPIDEYPYCMCCGSGRTAYEKDGKWISNSTGEIVEDLL